jgi:hypothetical protein
MKATKPITKAALVITSVLLSLLVAEFTLRWVMPDDERYYVWEPNLQHQFYPDSSIFYGIKGIKNFTINEQGIRGDLLLKNTEEKAVSGETVKVWPGKFTCNRLFLGGSTTECLYLDDKETWWYLWDSISGGAENELTTGSIGKSGITTRELYLHMKYVVPQLKYTNEVIIMPGLNDLMKRLSADTSFNNNFQFTEAVEDSLVNTIFLCHGRKHEKTWWRKTALFHTLQNFYHRLKPKGVEWMIQDDKGKSLAVWRENRKNALAVIDSLPDLTTALMEYKRNLQLIYREGRRQGLGVLFITQPSIYKDTMSTYEQGLLWMGGIGAYQQEKGHSYYSVKALKRGMEMYNNALREFCRENNIPWIDAAAALPQDTSVFYDDCHFNESGARLMAEYLSQQPFR